MTDIGALTHFKALLAHGILGAGLCSLPFRWSRPWGDGAVIHFSGKPSTYGKLNIGAK